MTEAERTFRRILLVGFMGSGKSRVGRALAKRLGWKFRDFDEEICSQVGLTIPEIFREHGEAFFREVEARVGRDLLREEDVVLASGGGWPAAEGRMEGLGPDTLSVWLKVTPEEAVRRASGEGPTRPLMATEDPVRSAAFLLGKREPYYGKAHVAIDCTGVEPEELVERLEEIVKDKVRR